MKQRLTAKDELRGRTIDYVKYTATMTEDRSVLCFHFTDRTCMAFTATVGYYEDMARIEVGVDIPLSPREMQNLDMITQEEAVELQEKVFDERQQARIKEDIETMERIAEDLGYTVTPKHA